MLHIVAHDNSINRFLFEEVAKRSDVRVAFFRERKGILTSLLKAARMGAGNPKGFLSRLILPRPLREALAAAGPDDTLLLWSFENRKYVLINARDCRAARVVSWLWNPMHKLARSENKKKQYVADMAADNIEVATFDRHDADMLGARLMPQVYRRTAMDTDISQKGKGAFFVGQLKGRGALLTRLEKMLAAEGMECDFYISKFYGSKEEVPENLRQYCHSELMPYAENLRRTAQAACVLDLVQKGQKGVTLRALEALFYGRKLITNNPEIKKEDFYRPANVWILDDPDERRRLGQFLAGQPEKVDEQIIRRHTIGPWLDSLMASES